MAHEKECLENVREQLDSLKKERMMRMWLRAKCTECDKESVDDWEDTLGECISTGKKMEREYASL